MLSCLKNVIILAQNNLTNEAKIQKKWPKPTFYNFEKKKKVLSCIGKLYFGLLQVSRSKLSWHPLG